MKHILVVVLLLLASLTSADSFDPDSDFAVLDFAPDSLRDKYTEALVDAGKNWRTLAEVVSTRTGDLRADALWLVMSMTHLDRLEAAVEILDDHLDCAARVREHVVAECGLSTYRLNVLAYRIGDEALEEWRSELMHRFASVGDTDPKTKALAVARAASTITRRKSESLGERLPPATVFRSQSGTAEEIAIAATAALRALGVPARRARCMAVHGSDRSKSWVEWFDGDSWNPLYPNAPEAIGDFGWLERDGSGSLSFVVASDGFGLTDRTGDYTETGSVVLHVVQDGKPVVGFEHYALQVRMAGQLVPLDDIWYVLEDDDAVTDSNGCVNLTVGDGAYIAVAGRREQNGSAIVATAPVIVRPDATDTVHLDLSDISTPTVLSPLLGTSYPTETILEMSDPKKLGWVAVHIEQVDEPTVRILSIVDEVLRDRDDVTGVCVVEDPSVDINAVLTSGWCNEIVQVLSVLEGQRPLVIWVTTRGEIAWVSEGADFSLGSRLRSALDSAAR
jgi:hypothetical protein